MSIETARATPHEQPLAARPAQSLGLAALGRLVFEDRDVETVWAGLVARYSADATDAGALLDISTLVQMRAGREQGLELQATALAQCRCYQTSHGAGTGLHILAFVTAGDLMANTPLDFLLEGSDAVLTTYYVEGSAPPPSEVPDHDIAFLAISHADDGCAALDGLGGAFDAWPRPVMNGRAELIAALSRDGVASRFAGHPSILCPATRRVDRSTLEAVAGGLPLRALHDGLAYPIIVRPTGSHAGNGLQKVNGPTELAAYLADLSAAEFFIASFFDYSGDDGLFRKLRVVFVRGRPFVSHMAVSARWMVHYLNADMGDAANRAEEAVAMETFDQGFAVRHRAAFEALTEAFGLDYYGIDCAETRDGRLLVFEADVAMIVHAMDPEDAYPYKKPAMAKLFSGFVAGMSQAARDRSRAA
jgi:hypothetical protein